VWLVGTIAATCTAFYMTRLVAMTFWGKERFLKAHEHTPGHEAHADHETPGHQAHVPHESPRSMVAPLVVLAVFATIGGLVGVGPAFKFITGSEHPGGRMNIVNFMDPIIWNPETRDFGKEHGAAAEAHGAETSAPVETHARTEAPPVVTESAAHPTEGFNLAHVAESALGSHTAAEWLFIVISLVVAAVGILLGVLFYVWRPSLPDIWAARLKPLYMASYNKYWIDEIYGWAITRRTMDLARAVFAFDAKVIDGAVNGSAWLTRLSSRITGGTDQYFVDGLVNAIAAFIVRLMSPLFRAAQTGFTQNYALVMVVGLVAAVALFFGRDIISAVRTIFAIGL
jgi:NADH-quinone oxidoreductase subunit L